MIRRTSVTLVAVLMLASCGGPSNDDTGGVVDTTEPTPTTEVASVTTTMPETTEAEVDLVGAGESLAARNGCTACHSPDGSPLTGPTWQGLFGSEEMLDDGTTVLVDEAFLRESIVDPNARITDGYTADVMPKDFGDKLTEGDIQAIIAYIESLR